MTVILFPDAEAVAVQYLVPLITGAHVCTEVPDPRPNRMVRISRTGGRKKNLIYDSAQLTFECWDTERPDASDLAKLVRAHVDAMPGTYVAGVWAVKVTEVGGPQFFPDTETNNPRYQFTVTLDLRGEQL